MISGTFHVSAQEWRYYSREKSLIHTLHLGQLPITHAGDTVLVMPVEQVKKKNIGFPPLPLPSGPEYFTNQTIVTNTSIKITCYGAVNCSQAITAQSKMGITVGPIGGGLSRIVMNPQESGFFVVEASAYTDVHSFAYQGVAGDGQATLQILNGGTLAAQAPARIKMEGASWGTEGSDIYRRLGMRTSCLVASNGSFTALGYNLGGDCCLSMWAMKVADYD